MKLKMADLLYRFVPGLVSSWPERAKQEQDALDALRQHPGFQQLRDVLDSEERAIFRKWRDLPVGSPEILDLHAEARAFLRLTDVIHRATHAKVDAEEAQKEVERQIALQSVDAERSADAHNRSVDAQNRLARFTQQARNGTASRTTGTSR